MIDSESDDRTANNAVRHKYRVLTDEEKGQMLAIKDAGAAFIALLHDVGATSEEGSSIEGRQASRELAIAQTKIEEATMWAVRHVTA